MRTDISASRRKKHICLRKKRGCVVIKDYGAASSRCRPAPAEKHTSRRNTLVRPLLLPQPTLSYHLPLYLLIMSGRSILHTLHSPAIHLTQPASGMHTDGARPASLSVSTATHGRRRAERRAPPRSSASQGRASARQAPRHPCTIAPGRRSRCYICGRWQRQILHT